VSLASSPSERLRLSAAAREAVLERSWERALGQLADGYARALPETLPGAGRAAA
jgi:hypothetical protein